MWRLCFAVSLCLVSVLAAPPYNPVYKQRFDTLYGKIHASSSGYFNQDQVPYHSVETLICEAPDYGHLTTSEAYSYYIWLETLQGFFTGDWSSLNNAYSTLEKFAIPGQNRQPSNSAYNPEKPADFAPEGDDPSDYPETLNMNCQVGLDPLHDQLQSAYGDPTVYGTHWLFDSDNWYGYGMQSDGTSRNGAINTFQRGPMESVWKTIPQPEWELFKWGGQWGFLDLFTAQNPPYSQQWRFTNAPDADARIIQALYWAYTFAAQDGEKATQSIPTKQASKLGDFLRYSMFDKYFKTVGSQTPCGQQSDWYGGFHALISWYYAWGGYLAPFQYPWSFRIGCEWAHFGYQNPMAAYALSQVAAFKPISSNGVNDWTASLTRQLDFYTWLQSSEGAIAGGATSSWNGRYDPYPPGVSTFNNMAFISDPSYRDPPSNMWFGWQTWSMERVAEYFYVTGDSKAQALLVNWVAWATSVVSFDSTTGDVLFPGNLYWSGQPDNWNGKASANANLHVTWNGTSSGVGTAASLAHTLSFYAAKLSDTKTQALAGKILDAVWQNSDSIGVSTWEGRSDYCGDGVYTHGFNETVYIPSGWTGTNAQGAKITQGITFTGMRPKYQQDPNFQTVINTCRSGKVPQFRYHRFWEQAEVAIAMADYARLFPN